MPANSRILAQVSRPPLLRPSPRWIAAAIAAVGSVSVIGALTNPPPTDMLPLQTVVESLSLAAEPATTGDTMPFVRQEPVRAGDSLRSLTQRLGVTDFPAIDDLLSSPDLRSGLVQIRAGRPATAMVTPSGNLVALSLPIGQAGGRLKIERKPTGGFSITREASASPSFVEVRSGVITSSLYAATDAADLPDTIANQLVEVFGTEIDFHTDLRRGDRFSVVFEAHHVDGRLVGAGRVLAAEFVNQGKAHRVFLFRDASGREDYYNNGGQSLKQGFLRSPVEFSRVTSGFAMRRHPILKTWRQHQGVDFGAPIGTSVKATADGTVEFIGTRNGYGNIVVLKHRDGYSTAYGHLNGFARGLRKGETVNQGQLIGYVGQTGWATGPHLHYEFRVAGSPRDPMRIALPAARPIPPNQMAAFKAMVAPMQQRLALFGSSPSAAYQ